MLSGCVSAHPFMGMAYSEPTIRTRRMSVYLYRDWCVHIGVGFDVARSTILAHSITAIKKNGMGICQVLWMNLSIVSIWLTQYAIYEEAIPLRVACWLI